jgi:hypothetical protein
VAQLQLEFKAAMATQGYTVAVPPGTQVRTLTFVFLCLDVYVGYPIFCPSHPLMLKGGLLSAQNIVNGHPSVPAEALAASLLACNIGRVYVIG